MSETPIATLELLRQKLCQLQNELQRVVLQARREAVGEELSAVAHVTEADTIFRIDKISESALLSWFRKEWPAQEPVQLVMEGIEETERTTFPEGTPVAETRWKLIIDPIDGTRNIMYDKRSAWCLAGLAPQRGEATTLRDIVVAAMTELPIQKQLLADQLSAVRGCGREGLVAERIHVETGERRALTVRPSAATDFKHGFASLVRFFPEAKALLAQLEEEIWVELGLHGAGATPLVFDDQYLTTGGQIYELLIGHDRMLGDLRPWALAKVGLHATLTCHPYDICTALLLEEAGGIIGKPDGSPLDAPLDTTSAIGWVGYANATLAAQMRPALLRAMQKYLL